MSISSVVDLAGTVTGEFTVGFDWWTKGSQCTVPERSRQDVGGKV